MKLKTMKYGRVFNLGNYESERIELEVEVEEDENQFLAFETLKEQVESMRSKR